MVYSLKDYYSGQNFEWTLNVQRSFYLHMDLLYLKMDDSGAACRHSKLEIHSAHVHVFCGYIENVTLLLHNYTATVKITQQFVLMPINLIYQYQVSTPALSHITPLHLELPAAATIPKTPVVKLAEAVQYEFMINTDYGHTIHFTELAYSNLSGVLIIFDGPKPMHLLADFVFNKSNSGRKENMKIYTLYYSANVYISISKSRTNATNVVNNTVSLTYQSIGMPTIDLQIGSNITLRNDGDILMKVVTISPTYGSYPNISATVRRFRGQSPGGCRYGGYVLRQFGSSMIYKPHNFGPFCTVSGRYLPFIDEHGMKSIVHGKD